MSVKTSAIVLGTVARVSSRTLPKTETRGELTFVNVLVVGDDSLADLTLGRDVTPPAVGTFIVARVEVGVFRDDDQITLVDYIDPAELVKTLRGEAK